MFITKTKHEAELAALEQKLTEKFEEFKASLEQTTAQRVQDAAEAIRADTKKLFEAALAADRKARYDADEPFVEIVSETFTEEGGVQLRLDWNTPFVNYLKKNGFNGPSDEAIVDNWLISLSRERIAEGGSEYK